MLTEARVPAKQYLGHQITKDGVCALPSKVTAIAKAPAPTNIQELHSFLGLLSYYGKFMPNLATILHLVSRARSKGLAHETILHPLNALLQSDRKWAWSKECNEAFQLAKELLTSDQVLTH